MPLRGPKSTRHPGGIRSEGFRGPGSVRPVQLPRKYTSHRVSGHAWEKWLNSHVEGSFIDRSRHREFRMGGMVTWRFNIIMECLPLIMQVSLLPGYASDRLLDGTEAAHHCRHDFESLFHLMLILATHYEIQRGRMEGCAHDWDLKSHLFKLGSVNHHTRPPLPSTAISLRIWNIPIYLQTSRTFMVGCGSFTCLFGGACVLGRFMRN